MVANSWRQSAASRPWSAWWRAGLLTAIVDGLFSSILVSVFYGSSATRLFQGVASTLFGRWALEAGATGALVGLVMHVGVAFGWSGVFLLVVRRAEWIRRLAASRYGVLKVAAAYGPFIWMVMSLAVIPTLTGRPPTIGFRWWVQFFGHVPFVAVPIVTLIGPATNERSLRY